ncbi:MAG TPA: hypothetical protein VLB04_07090 [Methanotrichaceae archaeon]|nr:hypothetical protein [Methanotrichaceae archaeon]
MNRNETSALVQEIMLDFARLTGLSPASDHPRRYLWTDAFAVCNYLELFRQTNDKTFIDLALRLVDQVHHTLGRHRDDDPRRGWISGLDSLEGERHPTIRGLRIGKRLNERKADEPPIERLEWDQDGQYYHYLTKWMHALSRVSKVTGDPSYIRWAIELAQAAHARFTCAPPYGGRKRMYWKMSIDLTYPLVPSMGQHDPLDGFVTYSELQATATRDFKESSLPDLKDEIADMAEICRGMGTSLATDDPLGIGGLLFDASRIAQLMIQSGFKYESLLETVVGSALLGMDAFARGNSLEYPAEYRLAFRELGLSIGLNAIENLQKGIEENPGLFSREKLHRRVEALMGYVPLGKTINQFWMDGKNREAGTWTEHREINMVMLATSLAPGEFLMI